MSLLTLLGGSFAASGGGFGVASLGGGTGSTSQNHIWQFALQGGQTAFPSGTPFTLAYIVSDFFGNYVPTLGTNTRCVLQDASANATSPFTLTMTSTDLANTQTITASYPAMAKGVYIVNVQADLSSQIWLSAPNEITVY